MKVIWIVLLCLFSVSAETEKRQVSTSFMKDIKAVQKWIASLSDETSSAICPSENFENNIYQLSECLTNHLALVLSKIPDLRFYDVENISVLPVTKENIWVAVLPFKKSAQSEVIDYASFVLDLNHFRAL